MVLETAEDLKVESVNPPSLQVDAEVDVSQDVFYQFINLSRNQISGPKIDTFKNNKTLGCLIIKACSFLF
jgi:hypothetical protein